MVNVPPGIYPRGTVDYHAIDAVNQSTLKAIAKSALHYKHRLENETEETDAMRLGTLAHAALLEPDLVAEAFAVWPPCEGMPTRRQGKLWDAFEAEHEAAGRTIVRREDLAAAFRMREAIRSHQVAARYFKAGDAELTLVWNDKETGILCKARIDWLSRSVPDVMLEMKTTRDVSPWVFEAAFAKRGYDVQTAFYTDGYEALTGRTLYSKCLAIESVEPHDVIVYDLLEVVDIGREIYRDMLHRLAECRRSGLWLGQAPTSERTLRLPKWRDPEDADDLAELGLEETA